jgi:predicted nucleotidyltransferase
VFSIEQRDRVHDRLVEMAREDPRVVAAAVVGSRARGAGDRWSDVDLTFGLAAGASLTDVLTDWTRSIEREFRAVHLFDLPFLSSMYRVFLLPGNLQFDLSFTPGAEFGALGPNFALLYGEAVERAPIPPPSAESLLGLGVHHAVRARFCIERGRPLQAEYWISGVRDQALALSCLRHGLAPGHARGYDDLPGEVTASFPGALVRSVDRAELSRALGGAVEILLRESAGLGDLGAKVEGQLRELVSGDWGSAG